MNLRIVMDDKTETELFYSIDRNEPETLQRLLQNGVDPNETFNGVDALGKSLFWSPLHFCCEKGREECARILLAAGANPDVGDRYCMTPLMYAVRTEWHNMLELMVTSGATVDIEDTRGRTPLHLATECSDDVCIKLLCERGADINAVDLVGRTPIWMAVTQDGRINHVTRLLKAFCDINTPDIRDKRIPLQQAIVYSEVDRVEYVRMLLEAGSDVNHRDEANLNSMLNLLYIWRRKGRPVNKDEMSIAQMLIASGYCLNHVPYRAVWHKFGGTAIKMAAEWGATELVELFLRHGSDPNIPDDRGVTPLLSTAFHGRMKPAMVLLRANCQLEVIGEQKIDHVVLLVAPLQCAIIRGHFELARLLIELGASTKNEKYLFGTDDVPEKLLENCDFWLWLVGEVSNPVPLFDVCLRATRRHLGIELSEKLKELPIPAFIRRCLLMEDVFQRYDFA